MTKNTVPAVSHAFTMTVDGRCVAVAQGWTVMAAIARGGGIFTRRAVDGALRGPLCGMGVCQECRVTIDGRAHSLACQTPCEPGMQVSTANDFALPFGAARRDAR